MSLLENISKGGLSESTDVYETPTLSREIHQEKSADSIGELEEVFSLIDHQGDGSINQRKLFQVMTSLGKSPTEAEVQDLINAADEDGNGKIEMVEFLKIMSDRTSNIGNTNTEVMEVFQAFDSDHDGQINYEDLSSFVKRLGIDLSEDECERLVSDNTGQQTGLSFAGSCFQV